jgi:hypothetical protein
MIAHSNDVTLKFRRDRKELPEEIGSTWYSTHRSLKQTEISQSRKQRTFDARHKARFGLAVVIRHRT